MMTLTQRIRVTNDRATFATLWLEPWGADYGMFPSDEFEVVATDTNETFYFHICYTDTDIMVYAEGGGGVYPTVYQNGKELPTGHNRQEVS
jgi:hypothetical protein